MARERVVIVGMGFGGLECAKKLDGTTVDVVVVDRNNYHVFTPLLYQVASSLLNASDIAFPIRKIFRGSPNVRFVNAEVVGVDYEARRLNLKDGGDLAYDKLVLSPGTKTNFFGDSQLASKSLGLKTLSEALQLRNHILKTLERASRLPADAQVPSMTFVIVGGGPTGVEYSGALTELMRLVLDREYPDIEVPARIVLVESTDQLLGMFSKSLGAYCAKRLRKLGVEVLVGQRVRGYDGQTVTLGDGSSIEAHTLVWSAGVRTEDVAAEAPVHESGRVAVDGHCRMVGEPDVFVIGDAAAVTDGEGDVLAQLSTPAMQEGRYVADFVLKRSDQMAPFSYFDKGSMAVIGRGAAVAKIGKLELTGIIGWFGWLVVHIYYLIGFRNRVLVLWQWMWAYLFYDRPVRIIARARRAPRRVESASPEKTPKKAKTKAKKSQTTRASRSMNL